MIRNFIDMRDKIDFGNLLVLEKNCLNPSTRIKYFFFHLLSVKFGLAIIRGIGFYRNHHKIGEGSNRLKAEEKLENPLIDSP